MTELKIWAHSPEKWGEMKKWWLPLLREDLEVLCLQGAQPVLREIIYCGTMCFPQAVQHLTVKVGPL